MPSELRPRKVSKKLVKANVKTKRPSKVNMDVMTRLEVRSQNSLST